MKKELKRQFTKKVVGMVIALCLLSATIAGSFVYVFASPGPTSSFYVEEGIYPGAPTYTIWNEDSTYYAKNANGQISSWGESSNASYVIQNAINDTTYAVDRGIILLKTGNFTIDTSIILNTKIKFHGEGRDSTFLTSTISDGSPIITTTGVDDSNAVSDIEIKDLRIEGSGSDGDGIYWEYVVRQSTIEGVSITNVGGDGIHFHHCFSNIITNVHINNAGENAIRVEDRSHDLTLVGCILRNSGEYGFLSMNGGAQQSIFGGSIQENTLGDIKIGRARGTVISGVYLENTNLDVWMINVTRDIVGKYGRNVVVEGCYFNGGNKNANGIILHYAYKHTLYSLYFEGVKHCINITSDSGWNLISSLHFSNYDTTINDLGEGNTVINDGYLQLPQMSHPDTGSWGTSESGRIWFCTTHNVVEYWNGTAIVTP